MFVSATPGRSSSRHSTHVAEQIIRPTGLVDPEVEVRPTRRQIDDLLNEITARSEVGERVLVTTLTKKMAEDLTDYLLESGVRTRYLHSEVDTLERIKIIRELRLGDFDVLVGMNLLREGLDLPEVSLVAILDADKEGFLRGQTALIQTIGRAARNVNGQVIMYADKVTEAIRGGRRRDRTAGGRSRWPTTRSTASRPETIRKGVSDIAEFLSLESQPHVPGRRRRGPRLRGWIREELEKLVVELEEEMFAAAEELRFEYAAKLRDEIKELRRDLTAGDAAQRGRIGVAGSALARSGGSPCRTCSWCCSRRIWARAWATSGCRSGRSTAIGSSWRASRPIGDAVPVVDDGEIRGRRGCGQRGGIDPADAGLHGHRPLAEADRRASARRRRCTPAR